MTSDETDRMVAATLAAAKASVAKTQTPDAYVEEYEAILAILQARKRAADTKSNVRG